MVSWSKTDKARAKNELPYRSPVGVILDRDGVINEERCDYVKNWSEFRFLPGALEAIASLTRAGFPIVVISNQSAINRGLTTTNDVEDIHRCMLGEIEKAGGEVEAVLYCRHKPEERCECRKPSPGLLRKAAHERGLELARCYLIGDKLSDIEAGQAVGCHCVLVRTGIGVGQHASAKTDTAVNCRICADISEAADWIIRVASALWSEAI
jgi:D-glycero-D-manno-heptose 1,7-bisphosphate phosphatase